MKSIQKILLSAGLVGLVGLSGCDNPFKKEKEKTVYPTIWTQSAEEANSVQALSSFSNTMVPLDVFMDFYMSPSIVPTSSIDSISKVLDLANTSVQDINGIGFDRNNAYLLVNLKNKTPYTDSNGDSLDDVAIRLNNSSFPDLTTTAIRNYNEVMNGVPTDKQQACAHAKKCLNHYLPGMNHWVNLPSKEVILPLSSMKIQSDMSSTGVYNGMNLDLNFSYGNDSDLSAIEQEAYLSGRTGEKPRNFTGRTGDFISTEYTREEIRAVIQALRDYIQGE
jgi:hypothetical protein